MNRRPDCLLVGHCPGLHLQHSQITGRYVGLLCRVCGGQGQIVHGTQGIFISSLQHLQHSRRCTQVGGLQPCCGVQPIIRLNGFHPGILKQRSDHVVCSVRPLGDLLDDMIGLADAKKVMQKALNYSKMQKLFEEKGVKRDRPAMHMVFTGNPGTAKTTVARLFARIMKENGLLSKGQLIEVGRADLVGKYVGWTAPTVKSKFKAALGGVLFIDEAYSLVEDRDGLYGDEAINTIVQEMENHRDDVVVIFAGYPDKMEGFLQKNPGLRSRIAFHVPFADYSSEELCCIAKLIGKNKGLSFSEDAVVKLETIFDLARQQNDFGNGRYVRNILEQARMSQATRLMEADFDSITTEDVVTIKAEDIAEPKAKPQEKRRIGFVA